MGPGTRHLTSEREDGPLVGTHFDAGETILAHNELMVSGWAAAATGIASVRVRIAGREYSAAYGLAPLDRSSIPSWPGADGAGFELRLDTRTWARGEHPFEIVAIDGTGARAAIEGLADVQPFEPPPYGDLETMEALAHGRPTMWCERPDVFVSKEAASPVEVSGWATSPAGIERVFVTIDERLRIDAVHGLARPDLRSRFGDDVAVDGGFAVRLDPTECPPGWHDLAIVAVSRDGRGLGVAGKLHCLDIPVDDGVAVDTTAHPAPIDPDRRFLPSRHRDLSVAPEHYARYRWAAGLVSGGDVLDAGCGTGSGTALLADEADRAVGVDVSQPVVAEATRHHGDRAEFVCGDVRRLPFESAQFDVVACFETLGQVTDTEAVLTELRRVLRPGGLLLVSAPNSGVYPDDNPFDVEELTPTELQMALQRRFANVAVNPQRTVMASLLGDAREGDELEARVVLCTSQAPGSELYSVAVATDGALPAAPPWLALGSGLDWVHERRILEMWQDRAVHAETESAASRSEAHFALRQQRVAVERARSVEQAAARDREQAERVPELELRVAELEQQCAEAHVRAGAVEHSASWRLTAPLRRAKALFRRLASRRG